MYKHSIDYYFIGGEIVTITCIYPEDMSILENKLIDTLTDIAIQKFTSEEIDLIVDYLEENDCKYFD